MDQFKKLIELNNKIELQKLSQEKYKYDSDDDEEDKEFIDNYRINFVRKYDKRNNYDIYNYITPILHHSYNPIGSSHKF